MSVDFGMSIPPMMDVLQSEQIAAIINALYADRDNARRWEFFRGV